MRGPFRRKSRKDEFSVEERTIEDNLGNGRDLDIQFLKERHVATEMSKEA